STPIPVMVTPPLSPELAPDDPRELVGHRADARGVGTLEHDTRERLGARVAEEDPPVAAELLLEGGDPLAEPPDRLERRLRPHLDVQEHLRKLLHAGGERGERLPRLSGHAQEYQRRQDAVAAGRPVEEQEMARLLAAQVGAELLHLLVHVAVPDLRLDDADARGAEGLVEAEVRHHGGDDDLALEPAARGEVTPRDRERVVAVADLPGRVHGDEPVAVAVEGEAHRRAAAADLFLEGFGVERADALVDIGPRRPRAERQDPRAEPPEGARRHTIRRAVGAVEDDRNAAAVARDCVAEAVA